MTQVRNPLKFFCAPNASTPDYIIYDDFHSWVAYGLLTCWFGSGPDPNEYAEFPRPYTKEDVKELRGYFLNLLETTIVALWKGELERGTGEVDSDTQHLCIGEDDADLVILSWYVRLGDDGIMFSLSCTGSDTENIWLSYEAIEDRANVLKVLSEARQTINSEVWDKLKELVPA